MKKVGSQCGKPFTLTVNADYFYDMEILKEKNDV